jgi:hypothetical protein
VVALGGQSGLIGAGMGASPVTLALTFGLSICAGVGFIGAWRRRVTAAELVVVASVLMVLGVPARTFRYILPLTPFLLLYFVSGIEILARWVGKSSQTSAPGVSSAARIALLCVIGFQAQDHAQYVWTKMRSATPPDWIGEAREAREVTGWMNTHLDGEGAVASTNPGLVYLLTGRKTVATDEFRRAWPRWRAGGIRYLVALRPLALPPKGLGYRVLYRSSPRGFWIIELLSSDNS